MTDLLERKIKLKGVLAWGDCLEKNLYSYGVEFTINEMERMELIKILNQVQIKMGKSYLFDEGNFVFVSPEVYFQDRK